MNLRGRISSWFRPRAEGVLRSPDPSVFITHPWLREAGVMVTAETALQVSAVYGCCRLIVDCLAPASILIEEVGAGGKRTSRDEDPSAYVLNWGAPVDRAPDAPPAQAIEEALYWSALLHGDGYAEIQRDQAQRFAALWPIEPWRITPHRDENRRLYYEVQQPSGGVARLEPRDVFHLRGPSLFGWVGDSPIYRAAKAVGIALASQVYAATYFANGTIVSGILKHPKFIVKENKDRLREEWVRNWGRGHGATRPSFDSPARESLQARKEENLHGVPLLDDGWDFQPINHDAQKSQLVESRKFQVPEIARYFGVPTTLLADNEAWTNLGELYLGFYRNALRPWAERFDAEATRKLFPMRQPWREVRHDLSQLTMGSFKDLIVALREAVRGSLLTPNEARVRLGANAAGPEGDMLMAASGLAPLKRAVEEPMAPIAPGQGPSEENGAGDEDEDATPPPPRRMSVAQAAVALDRYRRKVEARRSAMKRQAPEKLEENLTELRRTSLIALVRECGLDSGADSEKWVGKMADSVLQGEPPHLAAERFLGTNR